GRTPIRTPSLRPGCVGGSPGGAAGSPGDGHPHGGALVRPPASPARSAGRTM
ncbi:unnamed protein product, partial [Lampetra fluviatilis]